MVLADVIVGGQRFREPRRTTDWREAKRRERERLEQLCARGSVHSGQSAAYAAMNVGEAIKAYAPERRAQVSPRMAAYWLENARPLGAFFGTMKLRNITPAQIAAYQNVHFSLSGNAKDFD